MRLIPLPAPPPFQGEAPEKALQAIRALDGGKEDKVIHCLLEDMRSKDVAIRNAAIELCKALRVRSVNTLVCFSTTYRHCVVVLKHTVDTSTREVSTVHPLCRSTKAYCTSTVSTA